MRLTRDGRLGVGVNDPDEPVEVYASGNDVGIKLSNSSGTFLAGFRREDGDNGRMRLADGGTTTVQIEGRADSSSYINNSGSFGLGTSSPQQNLHVHNADAGSSSYIQFTQDTTDASSGSGLLVGVNANEQSIIYNQENSPVILYTNQIERMRVEQAVYIGDTSNAGVTQGLTINQGANDDQIIAFKSSDVAHGVTNWVETDTYCYMTKASSTGGGMGLTAFTESTIGMQFISIIGASQENTTKTTSAVAQIQMDARMNNGAAGASTLGADANLFLIDHDGSAKFIVDEDGDIFYDGSAAAYDSYDDAQLVRAFDSTMSPKAIIQSKWDEFVTYKEKDLVEANLMGEVSEAEKAEGVRPLVSLTGMSRLHNGAIWQQYTEMQKMKELMYDTMIEMLGKEKADKKLKDHDIKLLDNKTLLN